MAHSADKGRVSSRSVLRAILFLFGVCLVGYSIRPLWYLRLKEKATAPGSGSSCPQCQCHCSSSSNGLFPLPSGNVLQCNVLDFTVHTDCGKDDPELNEELRKDIITLTLEELELHKSVANETLEHTKVLVSDARRASSHYQKEAEKCNAGVEICEEARERAESQLIVERNLSTLWEERSRKLGWKDSRRL
ncbi:hypothetical protein G4B88_016975 [Cannabis sativa]|uniref:Uncharacterized protein n=1 Tax=Cannabis sativa TaxID=3483 RepID=A0A7J6DLV1_CANSA|nr:hypothetical protein G4B88_016975 [Cannabis sativa]